MNPPQAGFGKVELPEFCRWNLLLSAMAVAELSVLVVHAASWQPVNGLLLAVHSLFALLLVITCTAILCLSRPWLIHGRGNDPWALSWLVVVIITAAFSAAAWWGFRALGVDMAGPGLPLGEFTLRLCIISALLTAALLRYLYVRQLGRQQLLAQAEARVQALQSRIRPHFLFNTLNSIAALIPEDPVAAEAATEDLADLFRGALRRSDQMFTLGEELELARKYLAMEQRRLGERLQVEWKVDRLPADAMVPPLLLQPLVENACYHGIQPLPEGGTVAVSGARDKDSVLVVITNPMATTEAARGNHHIALRNIRERLYYHYAGKAELLLKTSPQQFQAIIRIPYVVHRPD